MSFERSSRDWPLSTGELPDDTYSVGELAEELRDFLAEAYFSVWVAGEVERIHRSQRGHLYFELVEKGAGDRIEGKLDAVLWRTAHGRISRQLAAHGQELREGVSVRCRGRVDFYPAGGRLQFVVEEIDPLFTLGDLERRRRETLEALKAADLLERNRRLPLPDVPLTLGLVTSKGSAAYHDFLTGLAASGYGFQVFFVHAAVQGREAERELPAALRMLGELPLDAVALIRGGGARAELVVFDSRRVAEAVARCPRPVLTGLGHEIDRSIADVVSHTALKTPTMVAEFLVDRVRRAELAMVALEEALVRRARERLLRARETLARSERMARVARQRLRAAERLLDERSRQLGRAAERRLAAAERRLLEIGQRLAPAAERSLGRRRGTPEEILARIATAARSRLRESHSRLDGLGRLCHNLAPARLLERGFSLTRNTAGAIVKDPRQLTAGERISSRVAGGVINSRVEELHPIDQGVEES